MASAFENRLRRTIEMAGTDGQTGPVPVMAILSDQGIVISSITSISPGAYSALNPKDPGTLYMLTDGTMYVGTKQYGGSGTGGGGSPLAIYVKSACVADGVTDDTAAFNALLATVYALGGATIIFDGMVRCNGQITLPNDGGGYPVQPSMRWTGPATGVADGVWRDTTIAAAPYGLDLRYNAPIAKIITKGAGTLEIDRIAIKNGGTDSSPFIFTTHTTLNVHDSAFSGSANLNDAFVFGGNSAISNGDDSAFQGYNTQIFNNFFSRIRRVGVFRGAANGIKILENTVSLTCDGKDTAAITAATNANPAVLSSAGHGFLVGEVVRIKIAGATGSWAALNGSEVPITILTSDTFSTPLDSTAFGPLTGAPSYRTGCVFDFVGSPPYHTTGNLIRGNLIELTNYGYLARLQKSEGHIFAENLLFDAAPGKTVAVLKCEADSRGAVFIPGYTGNSVPIAVGAGNTGLYAVFSLDNREYSPTYRTGIYFPFKAGYRNGLYTEPTSDATIGGTLTGSTVGKVFSWAGSGTIGTTFTVGTDLKTTAGQLVFGAKSKLHSPNDGIFTMWNQNQTGFSMLRFGTGSSATGFPALSITGTEIAVTEANGAGSASLRVLGALTAKPPASQTPANNGEMTFEATSNTTITVKLKGSDGVVRSAALTLV